MLTADDGLGVRGSDILRLNLYGDATLAHIARTIERCRDEADITHAYLDVSSAASHEEALDIAGQVLAALR